MMYEDDSIKDNKAQEQDETMDLQPEEEDFDDSSCDDPYSGGGKSKVKKYGLTLLVLVIFLGLFSGIMLRLDRIEDQMAASAAKSASLEATLVEKTRAMDSAVTKMQKTFQTIEDSLGTIAQANTGAIAAVEEIKVLYKDTDRLLREALIARDQLIKEIIGNLRLP